MEPGPHARRQQQRRPRRPSRAACAWRHSARRPAAARSAPPATAASIASSRVRTASASDGVLPLAPSLDHVGIMANCVQDLAIRSAHGIVKEIKRRCGTATGNSFHIAADSSNPQLACLAHSTRITSARFAAIERSMTSDSSACQPSFDGPVTHAYLTIMAREAAAYHAPAASNAPPGRLRPRASPSSSTTACGTRPRSISRPERSQKSIRRKCTVFSMTLAVFLTPATPNRAPIAGNHGRSRLHAALEFHRPADRFSCPSADRATGCRFRFKLSVAELQRATCSP